MGLGAPNDTPYTRVDASHKCPLKVALCSGIYADVRLQIPMTHSNAGTHHCSKTAGFTVLPRLGAKSKVAHSASRTYNRYTRIAHTSQKKKKEGYQNCAHQRKRKKKATDFERTQMTDGGIADPVTEGVATPVRVPRVKCWWDSAVPQILYLYNKLMICNRTIQIAHTPVSINGGGRYY